jgi:hypothetical protein
MHVAEPACALCPAAPTPQRQPRSSHDVQVEGLRTAADEEFRRRCALERALRDAASAFKRELFEKGEELASLLVRSWGHSRRDTMQTAPLLEGAKRCCVQEEVRSMRNWQNPGSGRCSAPPLAIAAYTPIRTTDPLCERLSACTEDSSMCPPWQAPARLCDAAMAESRGLCTGFAKGEGRRSPRAAAQFDAWHDDLSARLECAMKKLTPFTGGAHGHSC